MTPRERPIIFSAPMVRAILNGSKTQTRRIVKPQPVIRDGEPVWPIGTKRPRGRGFEDCPYGQPGDRLWVRETHGVADRWLHDCETNPPRCIAYRADLSARNFDPPYVPNTASWGWAGMKWRPSIHMPRWASRITLEVTGVRVERLQDISEADAIAEGVVQAPYGWWSGFPGSSSPTAKGAYALLWDSINGPGSWDANPWVWVVEFKRGAAAMAGDSV
ncbi:MAG: hypothetical protein K2W80_10315 [Burkholderiales bacterium]|nr:hypothetical protein [Burkholderiales bacterium]